MNIKQQIIKKFGKKILIGSVIRYEESFIYPLLEVIKPKVILEIGTFNGLSTILWGKYCEKQTITIDVKVKPICFDIWKLFELQDKIISVQIMSNKSKKIFCNLIDYDFVFVDGDHSYKGVKFDFECVKSAPFVLFHDYRPTTEQYSICKNRRFSDNVTFLNNLEPKPIIFGSICTQMALWINPDKVSEQFRNEISTVLQK